MSGMRVIGFTGHSGSGKTTAIEALIRHYVARGLRVGVVKHTHHEINTDDRGDTSRFRRAGASPVMLAGLRRAVVFSAELPAILEYDEPSDLLARFDTDLVFIEGFAAKHAWAQVELEAGRWLAPDELIARVEAIGG